MCLSQHHVSPEGDCCGFVFTVPVCSVSKRIIRTYHSTMLRPQYSYLWNISGDMTWRGRGGPYSYEYGIARSSAIALSLGAPHNTQCSCCPAFNSDNSTRRWPLTCTDMRRCDVIFVGDTIFVCVHPCPSSPDEPRGVQAAALFG